MSLKGLSDLQQKMIAEIIAPYMAIDTTIKKKALDLDKTTKETLEKAKEAVKISESTEIPLPKSTYDIARYGPAVEKVFSELDKHAKFEKVKKRVRKGVQYVQVLTFEKRSIEAILKKADKPKIKSTDDKKLLKQFLNDFANFDDPDSQKLFRTYSKLFIANYNTIAEHFQKGDHYLTDYIEKKENLVELNDEYKDIAQKKKETEQKIKEFQDKIDEQEAEFYANNITGKVIKSKKDDLNTLILTQPLSDYTKLVEDMLDTFVTFVEKQEIKLTFEVQGVITALQENIYSPATSIDQNYKEFIEQIIRYSDKAFGKKYWYIKFLEDIEGEKNLKANLIAGPGFNAWYGARQISKDIHELEQSEGYQVYKQTIALNESKIRSLKGELEREANREKKYAQDKQDLEKAIEVSHDNLKNWLNECNELT